MIMLKDGLIPTGIVEEKAFWHCDVIDDVIGDVTIRLHLDTFL